MKALRIKALATAMIIGTGAFAWSIAGPNPSGNFSKEHTDIANSLDRTDYNRAQLEALKVELKADKKADRKMEVIMDKKEIAKTKADIQRDKAHIKADKQDIKRDYRLAIKEHRALVADNCKALKTAKKELRRDVRNENTVWINHDAEQVTEWIRRHEDSKAALADLKADRNNDMLYVNSEIRASKAQFAGTTYIEDSRAHSSNWALSK